MEGTLSHFFFLLGRLVFPTSFIRKTDTFLRVFFFFFLHLLLIGYVGLLLIEMLVGKDCGFSPFPLSVFGPEIGDLSAYSSSLSLKRSPFFFFCSVNASVFTPFPLPFPPAIKKSPTLFPPKLFGFYRENTRLFAETKGLTQRIVSSPPRKASRWNNFAYFFPRGCPNRSLLFALNIPRRPPFLLRLPFLFPLS